MIISKIRAKTALGKSYIANYTINPYVGCSHACRYCYADYYTKRIYGITHHWGEYVFIKENLPQLLQNELISKTPGTIYISSLTDPYQPIESQTKLTRTILSILKEHDWPIIIQTKSALVRRDLDIFSLFSDVTVGFTIITPKENIRCLLEPRASTIEARISALKEIHNVGIKTYVFIGPIMPGTDFGDVLEIIERTQDYADKFFFDKLNIKPNTWQNMRKFLGEEVTQKFISSMKREYYANIKNYIEEIMRKSKKPYQILF